MRLSRNIVIFGIVMVSLPALVGMGTWVTAVSFAALAALVIFTSYRMSGNLFEPIALISFAYFLAFPLPIFILPLLQDYSPWWTPERLDPAYLEMALIWGERGFALLLIGYFLAGGSSLRPLRAGERMGHDSAAIEVRNWRNMLTVVGLLALVGCVGLVILNRGFGSTFIDTGMEHSSLGQVFHTFGQLRYGFFTVFFVMRMRWGASSAPTWLAVALLIYQGLEIMTVGSKSLIFATLISFLLAYAFVPKNRRWKLRLKQWALILVAVVVLQGTFFVIGEFRNVTRESLSDGYSINQAVDTFAGVITGDLKSTARIERGDDGYMDITSRLGSIVAFAQTLQLTGEQSPYEHAWQSFLIPVYAFIPLSIMPDKPHFYDSGDFARDYFGWEYGGVSMSLAGSLYWTWGLAGVPLGMFVIGLVFGRTIVMARNNPNGAPHARVLWIALATYLVIQLVHVDGHFHGIAVNLVRLATFLWFASLGARMIWRSPPGGVATGRIARNG
jgi:hypothetical protein